MRFVRGEGAGFVVLKPLSRALADGDRIYCTIRGSAANNDGASNGLTAPNPAAQEAVLREAVHRAGISPAAVDYVEAHGTGTVLGDMIEANALGDVHKTRRGEPCLLGSVKGNIGHTEGSAGIAAFIKVRRQRQSGLAAARARAAAGRRSPKVAGGRCAGWGELVRPRRQ